MTLDDSIPELELDTRRFQLCIKEKAWEEALTICGRYFADPDPFVNKLIVSDIVTLYVGLRNESMDRQASALAGFVQIPGTGILSKSVLDEFFYKSLLGER